MSASEPWKRPSISGGGPAGELRRRFPDAVVLVMFRLDDFLGALRRVRPEVFVGAPTPVGTLFYVVLDEAGLAIWSDASRDGLVTSFAWHEVEWVGIDVDNFTSRRQQGLPEPVIVFDIVHDGVRVPLAFYVMAEGVERVAERSLDERAMWPLVERARMLGAGADRTRPSSDSPSSWPASRPTAYALVWAAGAEAALAVAACVAWLVFRDVATVPLQAIAVPGVGLFVVLLFTGRYVGRAEARRGYTTLNGRFKFADEVDPKTGTVIRRAGDAKLTDAERRQRIALARSRLARTSRG